MTSSDAVTEEIFTALQRDLAAAERSLRLDLNQFWNAAAIIPFSILDHNYTELIPSFENFAARRLHARASALVRQGGSVAEVTATVETDLIPATIQLIVPSSVIPMSPPQPCDLSGLTIDYRPQGYWEYWLDLTWQDFGNGRQLSADLDFVWRHQFQLALRFSDQRDALIARLEQYLRRSLVDWNVEAWSLLLKGSKFSEGIVGAGETPAENAASITAEPAAALSNRRRKPVRRSAEGETMDRTLQEIAGVRPKNHRAVFEMLEGRVPPFAEPFRSAGGWVKGFRNHRARAHSWLSKAWHRLNLSPFRPGPKMLQ